MLPITISQDHNNSNDESRCTDETRKALPRVEGPIAVDPYLRVSRRTFLDGPFGAGNKIGGDQMGDFRCTFTLKAIDGYL